MKKGHLLSLNLNLVSLYVLVLTQRWEILGCLFHLWNTKEDRVILWWLQWKWNGSGGVEL